MIRSVVADALIQSAVVDVLVNALKDHQSYKQHPTTCVVPIAERIEAKYEANLQTVTISALSNELVA